MTNLSPDVDGFIDDESLEQLTVREADPDMGLTHLDESKYTITYLDTPEDTLASKDLVWHAVIFFTDDDRMLTQDGRLPTMKVTKKSNPYKAFSTLVNKYFDYDISEDPDFPAKRFVSRHEDILYVSWDIPYDSDLIEKLRPEYDSSFTEVSTILNDPRDKWLFYEYFGT